MAVGLLLVVGALPLLVIQASAPFDSWSDENIHMYIAQRVGEGDVPYAEVRSARPPLVIGPLAGLIAIGLSPLGAARILVVLAQLATAVLTCPPARAPG